MDKPTNTAIEELLGAEKLDTFNRLTECVDTLYDVDRLWNKGFGDWVYEYKYRRGGKLFVPFMPKRTPPIY